MEPPEKTYAFNALPSSHIIAETTMIAEGLRTYLQESKNPEFEHTWKKKNEADQLNACDALPEIIARLMDFREWLDVDCKNKEYIKALISEEDETLSGCLNHVSSTVMFCYVSFAFVKKFLEMRFPLLVISDKATVADKFGFWIPPTFENEVDTEIFSQIFANMNEIKDGLFHKAELQDKTYDEIVTFLDDVKKIYPQGVQVSCTATASLRTWRRIFQRAVGFRGDAEMRFTLLHLAYKFKKRYPNVFQDMSVADKDGTIYGFDSIMSSVDAWKKFSFHFAR